MKHPSLDFCRKRFIPKVTNQVTNTEIPIGQETQAVVVQQGNQLAVIEQENTITAVVQNSSEVRTYKKVNSWMIAYNLIFLITSVCGIVLVYHKVSFGLDIFIAWFSLNTFLGIWVSSFNKVFL